jgi:predicted porin
MLQVIPCKAPDQIHRHAIFLPRKLWRNYGAGVARKVVAYFLKRAGGKIKSGFYPKNGAAITIYSRQTDISQWTPVRGVVTISLPLFDNKAEIARSFMELRSSPKNLGDSLMKKRSCAATAAFSTCTVLLTGVPAFAQEAGTEAGGTTQLKIYGALDEGVEYVNKIATSNGTKSAVRVSPGILSTSYFGFLGNEELGGGLKAVMKLEGGFAQDTGTTSLGGRFFGRQAYVGLAGPYGELTLGRQYTMRFFATWPINPFGLGTQGLPTLDNEFTNPRADNSISYRVKLGKLETGVNYSLGRDAVNGNSVVASNCPGETSPMKQCREWSTMLKYEDDGWGATTSYERKNGGTSATFGGLTSTDLTDNRFSLGGYLVLGSNRVTAGWLRRSNEGSTTPKSNLYWLMDTIPLGNVTIDAMLAQIKFDDSPNKATVLGLRAAYFLSKRTQIYVTADHVNNSGKLAVAATTAAPAATPVPGGSQLSFIAGIKHSF